MWHKLQYSQVEEYNATGHLVTTDQSKDTSATPFDHELGENFEKEFNIDSGSLNKIIVHQALAVSWLTRAGSPPKLTLSSVAKWF